MAGVFKNRTKKDKLLEAAFRRELTQNPEDALLIAKAAISRAKGGDITAAAFIRDTVDGKPHQSVDMDVEVTREVETVSDNDIIEAFRKRMAGLIPERRAPSVEGLREPGDGGDQKPH